MKVTLRPSSGIPVVVSRKDQEFYARRANAVDDVQICLGVDLFEVIAELADLDLDSETGAAEATALAVEAQRQLAGIAGIGPDGGA